MSTGKLHHAAKLSSLLLLILLLSGAFWVRQARSEVRNFEFVSIGNGGVAANGDSFSPTLSYDGRYIAFMSWDTGWFPEDGNNALCLPAINCMDIFMRDRVTGETRKVTFAYDGGMTTDDSGEPSISFDGSRLIYTSYATNIVPNDSNREEFIRDGNDVFLYEWGSNTNVRISVDVFGQQVIGNSFGGVISGNGRYAYFVSEAPNLIPGISPDPTSCSDPILVGIHCGLIYRKDLDTGALEVLDNDAYDGLPSNGVHVMGNVDYSGRYLVFYSYATNLAPGALGGGEFYNVYLYDHQTDSFTLVSKNPNGGGGGNADSGQTRISPDGKYIIFKSDATNLVAGDTNDQPDAFLYEVATGQIRRVNMTQSGDQTNGLSRELSICEGGRIVTFSTDANNVIPNDTNGVRDIFFYDMVSDQVRVVSQAPGGQLGDLASHKAVVSPDCHGMAISSEATNFIPGDGNGKRDIFWAEIVRPATFLASTLTAPPSAVPGETIKYKLHVVNSGDEAGAATVYVPIPAGATYVAGSVSLGGSYNAAQNRIEWSGSLDGGLSLTISYDVVIDPGLTAFTLVRSSGSVTSGSVTGNVSNTVAVNATNWTFLPVSAQSSVVYP
ncbi:MAG: PD40 domain-containing protein [Anaerolineales bacterium]|nr:PD40 domain-containing protein [Anaerolineales bacterium]MCB8951743.1 PD40 domain-containing protein [Ardenticatenales bacterium]